MRVKCESVMADGKAVFNINKQKVFVPGVLLGEEVELIKKKRYELTHIYTESKDRIKLACNKFYECGGCQYLHIDYKNEQVIKERYINNLFKDIYKHKININFMSNELNYRNKVQVTFKESKRHQLTCGLYKEGTHDIITVEDCKLHNVKSNELIKAIIGILNKYKLRAYDEQSRNGILRHLLIRTSSLTNESLVTIVINGEVLPKRKDIVKDIINLNMGVSTIIENYNNRSTSIVLGDKEKVIYGPGFITDSILDKKFIIGSSTFFQINHEAVEILYSKAIEMLNLSKNEVVIDAYSGIGTIGICAANKCRQVISIESNKSSVNNAIKNAKANNLHNVNFICDDATNRINQFFLERKKFDALIMDPPRDGSTKQFIDAVSKLRINKVCYISCEPTTLKRDLEIFLNNGYKIEKIECVDMFPRTFNLESVVLLTKTK